MDETEQKYFWQEVLTNGHTVIGLAPAGQEAIGEASFVDFPNVQELRTQDTLLSVESEKAVTELHTPKSGTVVKFNQALVEHPEQLNQDSHQANWLVEIA
ncbi:glycine cleavage system protein H [Bombilactobacillus folatiphilus]|uniref:Glycine cleavage system protein H n=1 Tax=Bombilactobacillus folatiphilus TaxID=2923362 RepID=A0ABY4P8F1_9LACO|nr:glycine cleavage system protein H [Bombilactobacillus folatiphilus]UQS81885.1 glycine cleavage system protein H [Bombilactobacillus folatiphilus]